MDLLTHESLIRIGFFAGGLTLFWSLGLAFSFRQVGKVDRFRWGNNLALTVLNSVLVRIAMPLSLVALAKEAQHQQWGLLTYFDMPTPLGIIISVILLDGMIYFQHVVFHKVPFLWRLHRVHHSDVGFDATTALRFHPIEIALSLVVKAIAIMAFGFSPLAIVIFEVMLNFSAMFNHANFSLPESVERVLKRVLVTPDMHRVHHSVLQKETDSNYGFCLSIWDYVFRTYTKQSVRDLRQHSNIGVEVFRAPSDQRIDQLLLQPFRKP
jgi:sterol desaturase/sphingolipid hydroxylase (fatty acid hydroxylase superfamily)